MIFSLVFAKLFFLKKKRERKYLTRRADMRYNTYTAKYALLRAVRSIMTERNQKKLLTIYRIIFSMATVCLGAALLAQLWGIYHSQPQHAFSRASVGSALKEILPVILLWFACFILNIVLTRIYPQEKTKLKASVDLALSLSAMRNRFVNGGKGVTGVQKLRILRYVVLAVGGIAIAFCGLWGISYLFDKNYVAKHSLAFFKETNAVADRTLSMLPWLMAAALVAVAVALVEEYLQKRELSLLQTALVNELRRKKARETIENPLVLESVASKTSRPVKGKEKGNTVLWIVRGALCISAVVLIILGIHWDGMALVFEKARSICQQCIGLG